MAKIEQERTQTKYARVMHHIGGLGGKNDNSNMIQGGEDSLTLLNQDELQKMAEGGTDLKRLAELGAIREATTDEVERYEVAAGIRTAAPDSEFFTNFTTGNTGLNMDINAEKTGAVGSSVDNKTEAGTANVTGQDGVTGDNAGASADTVARAAGEGTGEGAGDANSEGTGGEGSGGSAEYKGMTKGELSEYTVPELKEMAKTEGVEGYQDMLKPVLLDTLLGLGK